MSESEYKPRSSSFWRVAKWYLLDFANFILNDMSGNFEAAITEKTPGIPIYQRNLRAYKPIVFPDAGEPAVLMRRYLGGQRFAEREMLKLPGLEEIASSSSGMRVLDLASSSGRASKDLASLNPANQIYGVDYLLGQKPVVPVKGHAEVANLDLLRGSWEALPFANGTFDQIISSEGVGKYGAFTNVEGAMKLNPETLVRSLYELTRVAAPDATLRMTTYRHEGILWQMCDALSLFGWTPYVYEDLYALRQTKLIIATHDGTPIWNAQG